MNLNLNEYTVIDDVIIIHWKVNKPIGTIDEKFKKLIFSNYDDINLCIKHNNEFVLNNCGWNNSRFNQPVILTDSLTHLTFGFCFNQQVTLTNSLTHLTFGTRFNQPVILTDFLTHLNFGDNFNQPINLTNSLTHFIIQQC